MGLLQTPQTSKGVLIALGAVGLVVVWLYATTLLTVGIGAVVIALLLYTVYVIGVRINRLFRDKRLFGGGS